MDLGEETTLPCHLLNTNYFIFFSFLHHFSCTDHTLAQTYWHVFHPRNIFLNYHPSLFGFIRMQNTSTIAYIWHFNSFFSSTWLFSQVPTQSVPDKLTSERSVSSYSSWCSVLVSFRVLSTFGLLSFPSSDTWLYFWFCFWCCLGATGGYPRPLHCSTSSVHL